ncbi:MAG: T9SS type A sorting domain-containing protein [Flavobacteriia bacterium]|nr:T9SS type A sorting domain-containing protein [Flavobacteriia bacterium]
MKGIIRLIFCTLLTFVSKTSFSQTSDSLSVFPNPFSTSANIHFELAQSDTITLRLIDNLGQTINIFYDLAVLPIGSYDINLNGDGLVNGIYFVSLDIGTTKNITKKVAKNSSISLLKESKDSEYFHIYPNPTNEQLNIPLIGINKVIIKDFNGNIIKSIKAVSNNIFLQDIPSGTYFIYLFSNNNELISIQNFILSR